ncbi:peptidyl-prolyl cis-trans isomerase [Sphaerisporangium rufum]|uniref:Peptidyl-prolyl cis-trans isomerase n=1 Tax=Sphaerisporangium rufum TaxID=1381558 RepID=A0A919R744_9ACTN|nr:peptidylprolyl isomerase [Sphaerisporangium rufum]GII80844.1 peptidyl-prolyl cis-trans isomerase [Sphaerisporangium rufum]
MATGKDRQKQLAREHYERQMARRAERQAQQKRIAVIGTTVGVVVVVGAVFGAVALAGGGSDDPQAAASASPSAPPSAPPSEGPSPKPYDAASGTCDYVADGKGAVKEVGLPPAKADTKAKTMTIATNHGDLVVDLATAKAPCTVNSFAFLAKKKYFAGTKCHRMGPASFPMLQCGDPLAKADGKNPTDGQGGPGYRFADENLSGAKYSRGVVAMANSGPGTNGSQFFIILGDLQLPPNYTPFGTVTKGLKILDDVAKKGVLEGGMGDGTGAPKDPVEFKSVTISGKS